MNKKECREKGLKVGYDIAEANAAEIAKEWALGPPEEGYWRLREYGSLHDAIVGEACSYEMESYRQYTPFEFFAKEINDSGDRSDGLWEAYDAGVARGADQAANDYLKRARREGRSFLAAVTRARMLALEEVDELALEDVLERVRRRLGLDDEE